MVAAAIVGDFDLMPAAEYRPVYCAKIRKV